MSVILSFLATTLGRYVVIGVGIVGLIGAFSLREQSKGAAKLAAKIEQKADANVKKADAARRSADKLPAASLRDTYFRD